MCTKFVPGFNILEENNRKKKKKRKRSRSSSSSSSDSSRSSSSSSSSERHRKKRRTKKKRKKSTRHRSSSRERSISPFSKRIMANPTDFSIENARLPVSSVVNTMVPPSTVSSVPNVIAPPLTTALVPQPIPPLIIDAPVIPQSEKVSSPPNKKPKDVTPPPPGEENAASGGLKLKPAVSLIDKKAPVNADATNIIQPAPVATAYAHLNPPTIAMQPMPVMNYSVPPPGYLPPSTMVVPHIPPTMAVPAQVVKSDADRLYDEKVAKFLEKTSGSRSPPKAYHRNRWDRPPRPPNASIVIATDSKDRGRRIDSGGSHKREASWERKAREHRERRDKQRTEGNKDSKKDASKAPEDCEDFDSILKGMQMDEILISKKYG